MAQARVLLTSLYESVDELSLSIAKRRRVISASVCLPCVKTSTKHTG